MDHAKTRSELFEKVSDENLTLFYREEIKRIDEGEKATELLLLRVKRRLLNLGILVRSWQNTLILRARVRFLVDEPVFSECGDHLLDGLVDLFLPFAPC